MNNLFLKKAFFIAFSLIFVLAYGCRIVGASEKNPFQHLKPPNDEWQLITVSPSEMTVAVQSKPQAVNVGVRTMGGVPIKSENFLDQVRSKGLEDPEAKGAEFTSVRSQKVGGKEWSYFIIKRKDEVNQEFWARKISDDEVLMVLYTAVGTYFDQYHSGFRKVLEQAAKD
jgi:hypothetical protein